MDINSYCINDLGKFIHAIKGDFLWESTLHFWFKSKISDLSQAKAAGDAISSGPDEAVDMDEFERIAAYYDTRIKEELKSKVSEIRPKLRDAFLQECQAYEEACKRQKRLSAKGFCFRWKFHKRLEVYKQECQKLNKRFSLAELAEIACSYYVEKGLGNADAARAYFLG